MFYVSFVLPYLPVFANAKAFNQTWCSEVWVTSAVNTGSFSGTDNAFSFCCNPGKYYNISKRAKIRTIDVCDKCPQGQYTEIRNAETTCTSCPSGWSQNSIGKQFCLPCEPGQTQDQPSKATCNQCDLGKYKSTAKSNETKCEDCDQGRYQNEKGEANCKACGKGKWSNASAALSQTTCTNCVAGKYSSATGASSKSDCNKCPPGKASDKTANTNSSSCMKCKNNTVAKVSGSTKCDTVPQGTIVISDGAAVVSKYFSFLYSLYLCFLA